MQKLNEILNVTYHEELSINQLQIYCFLVTNSTHLEMANCSERHRYICEQFLGKDFDAYSSHYGFFFYIEMQRTLWFA